MVKTHMIILLISIFFCVGIVLASLVRAEWFDGILNLLGVTPQSSFDPENPNPIGFETLDNGKVWHIWNNYDDYYFNATSGIQFSNHYQEYWTHNIFCGGYKDPTQGWKYDCNDALPFNWNYKTDNQTYVNITGWRDKTIQDRTVRLAIRYHLKLNDRNLTIQLQVKNIGDKNVPYDLGFAWKTNKIKVGNEYDNNILLINDTSYNLSQPISLNFTNMNKIEEKINQTCINFCNDVKYNITEVLNQTCYDDCILVNSTDYCEEKCTYIQNESYIEVCIDECSYNETIFLPFYRIERFKKGITEFLTLDWKKGLDYRVQVQNTSQFNAPITLGINVGTLSIGQEKHTEMYWKDAGEKTVFADGFEDMGCSGTNCFNTTEWTVRYGTDGNEADVQTSYGVKEGTYAAHMEEGDEGDVDITIAENFLDLTGETDCVLYYWYLLRSIENEYIYVDIYDGTWDTGVVSHTNGDCENTNPCEKVVDLSGYSMTSNFRVRWRMECNGDYDEFYFDNITILCAGVVDETKPQWLINASDNATTTYEGDDVLMYSQWFDETALDKYIFSWNASGSCDTWANDSAVSFTAPGNWTNTTKEIPSGCGGKAIGYKFYANDTAGNENDTDINSFTISQDTELPQAIIEASDNATTVYEGDGVKMYSQWNDRQLDKYIFSWNATGSCDTWDNETAIAFTTGNWTNTSKEIPSGCSGKAIGYKFYANDTAGNQNVTNGSFSVSATTKWLEVDWHTDSVINSTECTEDSPCNWNQYTTKTANATVTCRATPSGDCGTVQAGIRYNSSVVKFRPSSYEGGWSDPTWGYNLPYNDSTIPYSACLYSDKQGNFTYSNLSFDSGILFVTGHNDSGAMKIGVLNYSSGSLYDWTYAFPSYPNISTQSMIVNKTSGLMSSDGNITLYGYAFPGTFAFRVYDTYFYNSMGLNVTVPIIFEPTTNFLDLMYPYSIQPFNLMDGKYPNYDVRTCDNLWGFPCNQYKTNSNNTFDDAFFNNTGGDCPGKEYTTSLNQHNVKSVEVNATSILSGEKINATCSWSAGDEGGDEDRLYMFYYNGTAWQTLGSLVTSQAFGTIAEYNLSVFFQPNSTTGTHIIRCSLCSGVAITDFCADSTEGCWGIRDNDDVSFCIGTGSGCPVNPTSLGTLNKDQSSQVNFTLNLTGTNSYKLDFNFSSSYTNVLDNNTDDAIVTNISVGVPEEDYNISFTLNWTGYALYHSTEAGVNMAIAEYNTSTQTQAHTNATIQGYPQYQQTIYIPMANLTNIGNTSIKITAYLNESLDSSKMVIFGTYNNNPWLNNHLINSTGWIANSSLAINTNQYYFIWTNFTSIAVGDETKRIIFFNSTKV